MGRELSTLNTSHPCTLSYPYHLHVQQRLLRCRDRRCGSQLSLSKPSLSSQHDLPVHHHPWNMHPPHWVQRPTNHSYCFCSSTPVLQILSVADGGGISGRQAACRLSSSYCSNPSNTKISDASEAKWQATSSQHPKECWRLKGGTRPSEMSARDRER
jgi:hypothetical protein